MDEIVEFLNTSMCFAWWALNCLWESLVSIVVPSSSQHAVLLSAFIALLAALLTAAQNRLVAQKKAAMDFLLLEQTEDYAKHNLAFLEATSDQMVGSLTDHPGLAETVRREHKRLQRSIAYHLNHWEMMATLIDENVIDEDVCKINLGDRVYKRWKKAQPVIMALRSGDTSKPTELRVKDDNKAETGEVFFQRMERLVERWGPDPIIEERTVIWKFKAMFKAMWKF